MRRAFVIASLLVVASVCGFLAYDAFSHKPQVRDGWAEAAATVIRAERTKGQLPAIQVRERAANMFLEVSRSGPLETRSQAAMLAGLLQARNATADPTQRRQLLLEATNSLRKAIRLDTQNDDAAYDLELLLSRARATGHPISPKSGSNRKPPKGVGRSTPGKAGAGY
jgi:hypothetical protein